MRATDEEVALLSAAYAKALGKDHAATLAAADALTAAYASRGELPEVFWEKQPNPRRLACGHWWVHRIRLADDTKDTYHCRACFANWAEKHFPAVLEDKETLDADARSRG